VAPRAYAPAQTRVARRPSDFSRRQLHDTGAITPTPHGTRAAEYVSQILAIRQNNAPLRASAVSGRLRRPSARTSSFSFLASRRNSFSVTTPTVRILGKIGHRLSWKKRFGLGGNQVARHPVRHERSFFGSECARQEMREGPSKSAWRRRFQTATSCCDTTVAVVSIDGKAETKISAGMMHGDERKQTADDVSKAT